MKKVERMINWVQQFKIDRCADINQNFIKSPSLI